MNSSDAALQGASLAFQQKKKKPAPPPPKKTVRDNGALSAAVSAGSRPRSPVKPQRTGESMDAMQQHQLHPASAGRTDSKSPSFIAATLAASRSASPSPKARTPRRKASVGASSTASSGEVVDAGPLAPAGSLISMFEHSRGSDSVRRATPKRSPAGSMGDASDERSQSPDKTPVPAKPKSKPKPRVKPKPPPLTPLPAAEVMKRSVPEVLSPKPQKLPRPSLGLATPPPLLMRAKDSMLSPPSPDPQKRSPRPRERPPTPPKPRGSTKGATKPTVGGQRDVAAPQKSRPPLAPPRRPVSAVNRMQRTGETMSSDDTFASASSVQSPERHSPPPLPGRRHAPASLPPSPSREYGLVTRPRRPTNASTSSLALNNLTNAIMAGSIASARLTPHNTGSSLVTPPLPKRQKSPHLMQTLRQPVKASDDDSDRHKKGHLHKLQKGKHAHHEGSRKKWREEITERERKRYEAVWQSNRGLLLTSSNDNVPEYVVNVVVREIWKRSRLPEDELAEVWDLVNREKRGMLSRPEFAVGMWLIDQRLRGRKIPAKVSDSVWGSANGVRVIKPKVK